MLTIRWSWAIVAAIVACLTAGCGDGGDALPAELAARVQGDPITRGDLAHAMVGESAIRHSKRSAPPYWPGDVKGCIVHGRRAAGGRENLQTIRSRCVEEREQAKKAAVGLLIRSRWYLSEAKRRGMAIPTTRKQARYWGAHAGVAADDMYDTMTYYTLLPRLLQNVIRKPISAAVLQRQYRTHRERYRSREFHWIQGIVAYTQVQAEQAAIEMKRGRTSVQVVRGLDSGTASLAFTGTKATAELGDPMKRLAKPLRNSGEVAVGRHGRGWYVIKLITFAPSRQLGFNDATARVQEDLQNARIEKATKNLNATLRDRYGDGTLCAREYDIAECG